MKQGRSETVSAGDIETFERDGVVCLRNVLSPDEVEHLRKAVRKQMDQLGKSATGYDFEALARQVWDKSEPIETGAANRFDMQAMKDLVRGDVEARPLVEGGEGKGEGLFFYDVAAWKWDKGVRKVAFDSGLPGIATELLGASYLNFWEDTTFVKAPHTRQKTAFHQDLAYFQIEGEQCVVVWIPLDPVSLENGAMQYVRGSHKWGETYAPNVFISRTSFRSSPEKICPDIEAEPAMYDIVSFDVEPGDVIIHHVMTVHGAGGNPSGNWRRAMSLRYCGDTVRYFDRDGAIPQVGVSHDLGRGDRLFSSDYPIVWPKPWPGVSLADLYDRSGPETELD
ncbi:phytanoyl-CoA dioxygenase family protein [uncultured Hyphomonas sp.]|uniref:phytanoyl-CoA dioxygenase family protein n=1 Tax=uncultured Hyphomonas sp. TaxID=225298 RepID=UPI002AABE804|nr:phytanoyl-CoA dioxygenase family protein [uncultured Hyphomonas sp.]